MDIVITIYLTDSFEIATLEPVLTVDKEGVMIEAGSRRYWRASIALLIGSLLVFANLYLPQPLLPVLAQDFALSSAQASLALSVSTAALTLALLMIGPLSDAVGRKWLMIVSMAGICASTGLVSQADSFTELLTLRAMTGFFAGALPAIAMAYMGEEMSPAALAAAVGLYISGNSLGGIGGRLFGGLITDLYGLDDTFALMACFSFVLLLLFIWLLPESRHFQSQPQSLNRIIGNYLSHCQNPLLWPAYLIGGLNFMVFLNQYSYITFRLSATPYELDSRWLGLLFLTYLSGTAGAAYSGRLLRRWSPPALMALAILLFMLGTLLTLSSELVVVIAGLLLNALAFFSAHSAASGWVSRCSDQHRASAGALYFVSYYCGASVGGAYLGIFWQPFGWSGVVIGSLLVLLLTLMLALHLAQLTKKPGKIRAF